MNVAALYYGAAGTKRRNRNKRREEMPVKESLTEAAADVAGFWMIPSGSGQVTKLKVSTTYEVKGRSYPIRLGADVFPAWAVIANFALLRKHLPWLDKLVTPLADELMAPPHSDKWDDAMEMVTSGLLNRGWCCYLNNPATFLTSADSPVLQLFGEEFFSGKVIAPTQLTFDYEGVDSVSVSYRGRVTKMNRDKFAAFLAVQDEDGAGKEKIKYVLIDDFIEDWASQAIDFKNVDWVSVSKLFIPSIVNYFAKRKPGMFKPLVAFLRKWFEVTKRHNFSLPYNVRQYSQEIQDAIAGGKKVDKQKLTEARTTDKIDGFELNRTIHQLTESKSFSQLLSNTRRHGQYRVGGLVRVDGRWTNDVNVPGRFENARFIISSPPLVHIEPDGSVIYRWKFKSRTNRSTTGQTHRGYLRVLPKKKGIMAFLKRLIKGDGPWEGNCETWCSCFGGDALVLMADGTQKPIRDIAVGDMVITHTGSAKRVTAVQARETRPDENVWRMKTQASSEPFIITGEHPMYVLRGNEMCACGCGQELSPMKSNTTWSPELMLKRKCIQGHGGCDPTTNHGPKAKRNRTRPVLFGKARNRKKTTEEFINMARAVHRGKYCYCQTTYHGMAQKVAIGCRIHGNFWQNAGSHVSGGNCPECVKDAAKKASTEQAKKRILLPDAEPIFKWVRVNNLREQEWGLSPWVNVEPTTDYDPDVARLLGYYAAEGHVEGGNAVCLTFNNDEWDTLALDVVETARRLGMRARRWRSPRIDNTDTPQVCRAYVTDEHFQNECKRLVGQYSCHKRLSDEITRHWSDTAITQFLVGAIHFKSGRIRYMSVSRHLVDQVSFLLSRLRLRNSVSISAEHRPEGIVANSKRHGHPIPLARNRCWQASLSHEACHHIRPLLEQVESTNKMHRAARKYAGKYTPEEGQLRKVLNKKLVKYDDLVYDLTIEDDHSFVVNGTVQMNCQDFKFRMHYANWEADASHKPTGQNGDSTLEPPVITNPRRIPMLCKHLVMAGSVFLHDPPKKLKDEVAELQGLAREAAEGVDYQPPEPSAGDEGEAPPAPARIGGSIEATNRIG